MVDIAIFVQKYAFEGCFYGFLSKKDISILNLLTVVLDLKNGKSCTLGCLFFSFFDPNI